ncbi:MAG: EamA family transporter, partial [Candidatus Parcubacteria bacterium]|nr:EamA family transporter [Candidatus Parcubacteria bacterium]
KASLTTAKADIVPDLGCNLFDKFILEKRINNFLIYFVIGGIAWLVLGLIVLPFFFPLHLSGTLIGLAAIAGFLAGLNWLIFYKALTKEDVSRVIAIFYLYPAFVAIWAGLLLNERISLIKWIAVFLAIAGAIIISLKKESAKAPIKFSNSFLLILLGAALFEPAIEIIDKYALSSLLSSPLLYLSLSCSGFVLVAIILLIRSRSLRQQSWQFIKTKRSTVKMVLLAHAVYFLANLFFLLAVPFTKIIYVSTVSVAQPVFVFIFSIILSVVRPKLLKESLSLKTVLVKIFAIVLIVGSVLIITLF